MLEVVHLRKRFAATTAVDDITFAALPGRVTGFVGPNGAGKSTTMRMIVGLTRPTNGNVRIGGRAFESFSAPIREIGVLLEPKASDPGRSARDHLRWIAASAGIGDARVEEVLDAVGLLSVADRRVGGFSLGMHQRLGIAVALLGDPGVLMFDEPVNGLDPDGINWLRRMLRQLAAEGRTVFLSSHLMSEMAQTADHVIVIGHGRIIADAPIHELLSRHTNERVVVRADDQERLAAALVTRGAAVSLDDTGGLDVSGATGATIGRLAAGMGIALSELTTHRASLEDAFFDLTHDAVEFRSEHPADTRGVPV